MNTLSYIHKRSLKRRIAKNKTGKTIPWYKISSEGKCPDQDTSASIKDVYWNHFGCTSDEFIGDREIKGKNAEQCAVERMAEMKDLLKRDQSVDSNHIYPIRLVYNMGKTCLKNTLFYNAYIAKFKKYYDEITKAYPATIPLFHTDGVSNYPLETDLKNLKNFINSKTKPNQTNPIVYAMNTNKTTKNNSKQSSNKLNKTKKNVITHV